MCLQCTRSQVHRPLCLVDALPSAGRISRQVSVITSVIPCASPFICPLELDSHWNILLDHLGTMGKVILCSDISECSHEQWMSVPKPRWVFTVCEERSSWPSGQPATLCEQRWSFRKLLRPWPCCRLPLGSCLWHRGTSAVSEGQVLGPSLTFCVITSLE